MNTENYYARHAWRPANFIYAPAARRVMDYLIENTTSYPRCVDGRYLSPGRIIITRRRICDDLGITLRDLVSALNRLDLHNLISRDFNHDTIIITLPLDPDEITPPPTAETPTTETNEVGAQYIAPAQPALTPPQSEATPAPPAHSKKPKNPAPSTHSKWSVALDRPIKSPSKPRRGALVFSPMWKHGVSIQANENEPRRGGIVIPSKTAPFPLPKHSKWSVALDRPIRIPTPPAAIPIRGAPA